MPAAQGQHTHSARTKITKFQSEQLCDDFLAPETPFNFPLMSVLRIKWGRPLENGKIREKFVYKQ